MESKHSLIWARNVPIISLNKALFQYWLPDYFGSVHVCLLELLIGTRESKDSRVQAGLASPSPAFKGLVDSPNTGQISSQQPRACQIDSQAVIND